MKEKNIADKMAEKAFNSKKIQDSWLAHMAAFGPILEPAFETDFQSRVHLTAALNLLSNRKVKESVEKLAQLKEKCVTDADWAAWHFFMGVVAELSSKPKEIVACYEKAAEYDHKFYLPYIKLARYAHFDANFDAAEKWYWKGISCLENKNLTEREAAALASTYANLCSCLTMMHRYEDACMALERSKAAADKVPSRLASEAILYAAMGQQEQVSAVLELIKKQVPGLLAPTVDMTEQIAKGEHAHFAAVPMEEGKIDAFWKWFSTGEITEDNVQTELAKVFSFMQRPMQVHINNNEIQIRDFYTTALSEGCKTLLHSCPDTVRKNYQFIIIH